MEKLHFASDYMEGAHPAVLEALINTNGLATPGYGTDSYCTEAKQLILSACDCPGGEVYFLVGGTQTNALVIDAVLRSYQGVIAASSGHVAVHEAGAIEYGGHKVLVCEHDQGKISASRIKSVITGYQNDDNREHMVMPGMVYISQPTEYGTLYSKKELAEISGVCRTYGIPFYVDGARLAYALAAPENDVTLEDLAKLADIFYIGGTKCGLLFGEALVIPQKGMIPHIFTVIKQHGALLAKGRLLGVQFAALFKNRLYEQIGIPAVTEASRIKAALKSNGFEIPIDSPTNQVFFIADDSFISRLGKYAEYGFMEKAGNRRTMIRFATSWATTAGKVDELIGLINKLSVK